MVVVVGLVVFIVKVRWGFVFEVIFGFVSTVFVKTAAPTHLASSSTTVFVPSHSIHAPSALILAGKCSCRGLCSS